jgi:hypothetical protein
MAQVALQVLQPHERPDLPVHFLGLRHTTETTLRGATRLFRGKTLPDVLLCRFGQMAADLVVEVAIPLPERPTPRRRDRKIRRRVMTGPPRSSGTVQ